MIWLYRTLAILALTFGVGLLWIPFPVEVKGDSTRDVVALRVGAAPFSLESARTQFGEPILELSYENLEQTPELREAVLGVWSRGGSRCFPALEWEWFLAERALANPELQESPSGPDRAVGGRGA